MMTHVRSKILSFAVLSGMIASMIVPQAIAQTPPESSRTIEMSTYCLDAPPGADWVTEIDRERNLVRFTQTRYSDTNSSSTAENLTGVTEILVARHSVPLSQKDLDEQEIADRYRDEEQKNMVQLGVSQKRYQLTNIERGVVTIGRKTLYYMRYQAPAGSWVGLEGTSIAQHAVLYLYFPPGFTPSRHFYVFHIHEAYQPADATIPDLAQINPVITSFRIRNHQ